MNESWTIAYYHTIQVCVKEDDLMNEREKEYCKLVGNALRRLRKSTGKSVRLFAYENDLPQATLSRIERGDNEVKIVTLKKIAESFNLSMSDFFKKIENLSDRNFKIFDEEHY